ncbi:MAG TPA: condensation domain-containing protein [Verrucomicrobiales bacterium]|nr:condensation domain-containing protein [Verrucomicrobiales bacterium]
MKPPYPAREPEASGVRAPPFAAADLANSLGTRFERIAGLFPSRVAVRTPAERLTYEELNLWANRIAHAVLQGEGESAPGRAALLGGQEAPLIAALLGATKTGWCTLPLDPFQSDWRLAEMLEDAQCELLLSDARHFERAQRLSGGRRLLRIDGKEGQWPEVNPGIRVSPEGLANLVYTSGSTGRPKGAMQTHRQILRSIREFSTGLEITAEDRIPLLALTSASQGLSTVFLALLNGAELQPYAIRESGIDGLSAWLEEGQSTAFISAATVFRRFVATLEDSACFPALRIVRLGSEAVYRQDTESWRKHCAPSSVFVNALSSSETGNLTQWRLPWEADFTGEVVPAGFPVGDIEILLLDESGRKVEDGEKGEMVVRSRFLSPGYWRRPELTRAAFRSEPEDGGLRRFYSGDIAVRLEDESLEVRGRRDLRVKIRGFRVEPAEVECALVGHPDVEQAVVVSRTGRDGEPQLAACVVSRGGATGDTAALRTYLRDRLPEWTTPSVIAWASSLPMTPNGKADRRAAANLIPETEPLATAPESPRTEMETLLREIWQEVLGDGEWGIFEHFFDVGGDSLKAGRILTRLRARCGVGISIGEFLEAPTIASLTECVERRRSEGGTSGEPPLLPETRTGEAPLSFAQQRLWFLHHWEPMSEVYNLPRAYQLTGTLDEEALEHALSGLIARHDILRTTLVERDGIPAQRVAAPVPMKMARRNLTFLPEDERLAQARRIVEEESRRSFDLAQGPLFRVLLIRLGKVDWVLFLNMHHVISDRWSRGIMTRELSEFYAAFTEGRTPELPPLPLQYADYARWEQRLWAGGALSGDLAYWKGQLAGCGEPVALPVDHDRGREASGRGAVWEGPLPESLTTRLAEWGRGEGVTMFMTLLTGFYGLLHRLTRSDDILVGSTTANRGQLELEGLIGMFVNTVVLRGDLSLSPSFRELLRRTRRMTLQAFAHQRLPFDRLVTELRVERCLNSSPLIRVMFGLQNAPRQPFVLRGVAAQEWKTSTGTAKFDLSLNFFEKGGGFLGVWEYRRDLFEEATVADWHRRYVKVLEEMAQDWDRPVRVAE